MESNQPDLDGRYMRWCEHHNIHEIWEIDKAHPTKYICEDCGDTFPLIGDDTEWAPKLIGTRLDA